LDPGRCPWAGLNDTFGVWWEGGATSTPDQAQFRQELSSQVDKFGVAGKL
jgi:hypothetical protein